MGRGKSSAFAVLELDELRRRAHRGHADDDVETSPVADDCSNFEHGRMRTPTGCTTWMRQGAVSALSETRSPVRLIVWCSRLRP